MNKALRFFLLVFVMMQGILSYAQVNDAGLWMGLNAEKKLSRAFSVTLSEELRMNENVSEVGSIISDVGLAYKVNKWVKVSVNYRFSNKRRLDDSYSNRHRYYFDLTLKEKFKPVVLSLRTRYQSQYADIHSSSDGKTPKNVLREKLTVKLDLNKKYSPYVYAESYTSVNDPDYNSIKNMRYCGGVEYAINRMHSLDLFYLYQKEYNVKNPQSDYVVGIGYFFSF